MLATLVLAKRQASILVGEASGNMASPAYKRKVYDEDWYLGETFDAAIGQSFTLADTITNGCYAQ